MLEVEGLKMDVRSAGDWGHSLYQENNLMGMRRKVSVQKKNEIEAQRLKVK